MRRLLTRIYFINDIYFLTLSVAFYLFMLDEKSDAHLNTGLEMVGKAMVNIREWTGKFAEEQHKHQYPTTQKPKSKVGSLFVDQLNKFKSTLKQCSLCLTEKPSKQFYKMCKCQHEYCYNCLNAYAISRIQDQSAVICPQQDCTETMPLSSQIYKYLPDNVKIQFLNNKHARKRQEAEKLCPKCLEEKHPGECKFAFQPAKIQYAYHYRMCSKCRTQINLTEGKRRVKCQKCGHVFCYFCGTQWFDQKKGENHQCGNRGEVKRIEQEFKQKVGSSCSECCVCSCQCCCDTECACCQCGACRACDGDFCCEVCFYCDCNNFNPICCCWNIFSIPFRIFLTLMIVTLAIMAFGTLIFFPLVMAIIGLIVGFACALCILEDVTDSIPIKILMVIFYPITALIATFRMYTEICQGPAELYGTICESYSQMAISVWVDFSPKSCA